MFLVIAPEVRIVPREISTMVAASIVRIYVLEDDDVLDGMSVLEIDLTFDEIPDRVEGLISSALWRSLELGSVCSWFGFEGSFHYEHLLTPDIATQIYAVGAQDLIELALDDEVRRSEAWLATLAAARRTIPFA